MIQIYHPDGTVEFIEEKELYSSISSDVSTSPSTSNSMKGSKIFNVPTTHTTIYNNEATIGYVIQSFRKRNAYISEKEVLEYRQKVTPALREYFINEVNKVNAPFIAQIKQREQELLELKEIERRKQLAVLARKKSIAQNRTTNVTVPKKLKTKKKKNTQPKKNSSTKATISKIQAQLQEIKRQDIELKKTMLQCVQETGGSIQLGNFKISKLK